MPRHFHALLAVLLPALLGTLAGQTHGLDARPDVGPFFDGTFPEHPPTVATAWSTVPAFPHLSFINPIGLASLPGTNKLVVWEREGRIWAFENDPAASTKTLVVDLSANCQGWDDSGLLGVAPHPDFINNRQIYVYYNWRGNLVGGPGDLGPVLGDAETRPPVDTPTRNRLSRFVLDSKFQSAASSEFIVFDQKDGSIWHNGGGMFFHPENGFLYLTNGDDANPSQNGQRIDGSLFSGVLRIDVDMRGGTISHPPVRRPLGEVAPTWPNYYIPHTNPFVGQPGVLEEFFAIGLRSPHRMTLDAVSGRIFIGDVGSGAREEISVIEPNDPPCPNLQWPLLEGNTGDLASPFIGSDKRPVIDYAHGIGDGSCVIGGYVYRGSEFPELFGKYVFGDNMSGIIWYLDETTKPASKHVLAVLPDGPGPNAGNDYRGLSSFGLDASGELYVCQMSSTSGAIYKLRRDAPDPGTPLPATLGATGLFSDLTTLEPSDKLLRYEINAPFWSDGALKSRFLMIPTGTTIDFAEKGSWTFPPGSVMVKHFDLPISDVDPSHTRHLETRVLVVQPNGEMYGATYKWRNDQTEADLLDTGLVENFTVETASGTRQQPWVFPSRQDCMVCHNYQAGAVLGLNTRQTNLELSYPNGVTENQLLAWGHIGLFGSPPAASEIPSFDKLHDHDDTSAPLDERARSYLDANCSYCHRSNGVGTYWDARYDTPFDEQGIYYGALVDDLGEPANRVVVPRDPARSTLFHRINTTGEQRMPPLARNNTDTEGVRMLEAWIQSLPVENVTPPGTLAATALSNTSISLNWTDFSDNEVGFNIERSIDGGPWLDVGSTDEGGTGFTDNSAQPYQEHRYRVMAVGPHIESAPSNVVSVIPDAGTPAPEIHLLGNVRAISDGDLSPSPEDGTDFGFVTPSAPTRSSSFLIKNLGNLPLSLSGTPRIHITGPDSDSFSIAQQPPASLDPGTGFSFSVEFTPVGLGRSNATVTIVSNDTDEPQFTFALTGNSIDTGMVGWWRLDDAMGTIARDSTDFGHDGILTQPLASWNPEGYLGGAITFDGQYGQLVQIPSHPSLNLSSAITVTAWARAEDYLGNRRIVEKGRGGDQYRLLVEGGKLVFGIAGIGDAVASLPPVGEWHHYAGTYDGAVMTLYLDGIPVASVSKTGVIPSTEDPLCIGARSPESGGNDHWKGDIDDVRLYGRALSSAEIEAIAWTESNLYLAASDPVARRGTGDTGTFTIHRTGGLETDLVLDLSFETGPDQALETIDFNVSPPLSGFHIPAGSSKALLTIFPVDTDPPVGPKIITLTVAEPPGHHLTRATASLHLEDSPVNDWKVASFGGLSAAAAPEAADAADYDRDGIPNLLEAALGSNPRQADPEALPYTEILSYLGDEYLTATYIRPRPPIQGLSFQHEFGDSLGGDWSPAVIAPGYPVDNGDGTETVIFASPVIIPDAPRQFLRLGVIRGEESGDE